MTLTAEERQRTYAPGEEAEAGHRPNSKQIGSVLDESAMPNKAQMNMYKFIVDEEIRPQSWRQRGPCMYES